MAIGREVEPLAAAALLAVVSERLLQLRAPGMDRQVVGLQQQLDGVEPVQDLVLRPPIQAADLHEALLDPVLDPAGAGARLAGAASGDVGPDPPVAGGRPLAGPAPGMRAAPTGRQAARAGLGVPIPGQAVGDLGCFAVF